jgi:hypothetical protein
VTEVESSELAEAKFDDHMACEGVIFPPDPPSCKDNSPDIMEPEAEQKEIIPSQRMLDTDISGDQHAAYSERSLYLEAVAAMLAIPDQFRLSMTEIDEVIGSFQNLIAIAPTDLFLKPIRKKNRCAWVLLHERRVAG